MLPITRRRFLSDAFAAAGAMGLLSIGCKVEEVIAWTGHKKSSAKRQTVEGATDHWEGFPNSSGVPSSPVGAWQGYINTADRTYCRRWDATYNGTATHVNMRGAPEEMVEGLYVWAVLFSGANLIGYYDILNLLEAGTWSGEIALTEVSSGSLNFLSGAALRFGVAFDGGGTGNNFGLSWDDGVVTPANEFSSESVGSTPPATRSWSQSATMFGLASILRTVSA